MVAEAVVSGMDPILRAIVTISVLVFFAKLLGGIFSGLKLPSIIGELLAGIIFGPYMLGTGIIVFGEPLVVLNEFVDAFAEIGVIMILFSAGLEMGATSLRRAGPWAFVIAAGGALPPLLAGYYLYSMLGYSQATALMIGALLVATSLAVTVKVLEDFNALKTEEGTLLINSAVVDDVLGIVILAVITGAIMEAGAKVDLLSALRMTSIFFLVWLIMVALSVYMIPRMIEQVTMIRAEGAVEAAAIGSAFIMAAISGALGLSPIIGSYAAGMAVAESKALVRIKDFTRHINQIFSPLFFTVLGAKVNITLFNEPVILGILLLTAVAFVTKFVGSFLTSLPKLRSMEKSLRLGIGMVPRGELGLVIAGIGLSKGVLQEALYVEAIGMVLLTTFLAPVILSKLYQRMALETAPG